VGDGKTDEEHARECGLKADTYKKRRARLVKRIRERFRVDP
jgi:hypothetical protein